MAKLRIGSLIAEEKTNKAGQTYKSIFLGLGNDRNKDPKFNTSVQVIIRDHQGKVVHDQTNGFINLVDPRTQPDDLLRAGIITEEVSEKMKAGLERLPEKIKYTLEVNSK